MSTIPQSQLFVWEDIENSADLYRLRLVLRAIPDGDLMKKLEAERRLTGNNGYPIRPTRQLIDRGEGLRTQND